MLEITNAQTTDTEVIYLAQRTIAQTPGLLASRPDEIIKSNIAEKIEFLTASGQFITAKENGIVLGHALLEPMALKATRHILRLTIAVHPGNERRGIGEALLSEIISRARKAPHIQKIELNVRSSNLAAIGLYQKMGFFIQGRQRLRLQITDGVFVDDLEMGLFVKTATSHLPVVSLAIGTVISERKEAIDDDWDRVKSVIQLDPVQFGTDAVSGLEQFSHIEVIFYMNAVKAAEIERGARHPRGNPKWPKVGILSQRAKNRPNQLGSTICSLQKVDGISLHVTGLDAVDGTPILDIKPWVQEFGPRGTVHQPKWISELMQKYWIK